MGETRAKRAGQRTRSVGEDWLAWIPNEMGQLFDTARKELEASNSILNITIDEALQLCKDRQWETAGERIEVFAGLFSRLALRVLHVIRIIRDHGNHFGTVPNVEPLSAENCRSAAAQKVSRTDNLLAKVVFGQRSRFFHKLYAIEEIVEELQQEMRAVIAGVEDEEPEVQGQTWQLLEVLGYDMSTCMGETTILLKSFFCALPAAELPTFREKLIGPDPTLLGFDPRGNPAF